MHNKIICALNAPLLRGNKGKRDMKGKRDLFPAALGILAALILMACSHYGAYAETVAIREGTGFITLEGCMERTGADADIFIAECLRVNLVRMETDGVWAEVTLHQMPDGICGVLLFDGWHLLHGEWKQSGENTLHLHFRPDELAKLDGTVGLYLLILADR